MKTNRKTHHSGIFRKSLLLLLMIVSFTATFAGDKISLNLKSQAIVVGPEIRLLDVCTVAPNDKNLLQRLDKIVLGRAAPPGEAKEISRSLIKMHLRRVKLYDQLESITGPRSVRVQTAQKDITRVKIEDAVATFISKKLQGPNLEWRFDYLRIAEKIAGPVEDYELKVHLLKAGLDKGHTALEVRVLCDGKTVTRTKVTGILRTFETVAVARDIIDRGNKISSANFLMEKKRQPISLVNPSIY